MMAISMCNVLCLAWHATAGCYNVRVHTYAICMCLYICIGVRCAVCAS